MKYFNGLMLLVLCLVNQNSNAMGAAAQAARQTAVRTTTAVGRTAPIAARNLSTRGQAYLASEAQAIAARNAAINAQVAEQTTSQPTSRLIGVGAAGLGAGTALGAGAMGYSKNTAEQAIKIEEIYMPAYNKGLLVQQNLEKLIADPKTATTDTKIKLVMSYLMGETYEPKPLPCQVNYERARQILDTIPRGVSWSNLSGDKITAADILRRIEETTHESEAAAQARVKRTFTEQEGDLLRQQRLTRFTKEMPKA